MRRTKATDCRTLPFPPAQVFAVVLDASCYSNWWPAQLRVRVLHRNADHIGSRFEVRANGGRFICEITSLIQNQELRMAYVDGVHRGTGTWTLEATEGGTRVCYEIDLEPHGLLPRLLSTWMDFGKMHSKRLGEMATG